MRTVPVPTALPQVVVVFMPGIATGSGCQSSVVGAKKKRFCFAATGHASPDAKASGVGQGWHHIFLAPTAPVHTSLGQRPRIRRTPQRQR